MDQWVEPAEYEEGGGRCDWDIFVGDFRGEGDYAVSQDRAWARGAGGGQRSERGPAVECRATPSTPPTPEPFYPIHPQSRVMGWLRASCRRGKALKRLGKRFLDPNAEARAKTASERSRAKSSSR